MSRTDREDATARALDLLPPGDEARSDPRLLRDPELLDEARLTREAAADVWLAVSPLRAAPSDVLHAVMARIDAKPPAAAKVRRFTPWIAASGWAAAVVVAVSLWPQAEKGGTTKVIVEKEVREAGAAPQVQIVREAVGPRSAEKEDRRLRSELMKLRGSLARLSDDAILTAPRVMSLNSPGGVERSPEEARARVWAVLTGALRTALEAESGAPNDPAALVIERGWLPDGVIAPEDGGVIRHRNFPESAWQDYGLLKSDEGTYYDPERELVWNKDEEGRGFIGRKATTGDDLTAFRTAEESPAVAANQVRTAPEGFVIEDPVTNKAEVVIDQVPAPAEGMEHHVVWKDSSGTEGKIKLGAAQAAYAQSGGGGLKSAAGHAASPLVFQSPNVGPAQGPLSNTIVLTIPNSGGVKSFQLIESPVIPNGTPFRVIVQGGN